MVEEKSGDQSLADWHPVAADASSEISEGTMPEDFEDQFDNLTFQKKRNPGSYLQTLDQIKAMAAGENPNGIRIKYYSGWENKHFAELLKQMGEEK